MRLTTPTISRLACFATLLFSGALCASAREIHVAKTGDDSGNGSQERPYLTIAKASEVAQPGDVITVHAGTYREWVKPVRGGDGENNRITYRAAPGEEATIKGSERIASWTREGDGVWKVELPNAYFGDYNPYALNVSGGWLNYGQWHHRGDVYLNGEAFYEKQTVEEVQAAEPKLVLSSDRSGHDHPCQLWPGRSERGIDRDQRSREPVHAGDHRPEVHHDRWASFCPRSRELGAARVGTANRRRRHTDGKALDYRELHDHQRPLRRHHFGTCAGCGLPRHRRVRRPHYPQQCYPALRTSRHCRSKGSNSLPSSRAI